MGNPPTHKGPTMTTDRDLRTLASEITANLDAFIGKLEAAIEKLGKPSNARLEIDPLVSAISPVVKGTWVTVDSVRSLLASGMSWSDLLRVHPELELDDIQACLDYEVERVNARKKRGEKEKDDPVAIMRRVERNRAPRPLVLKHECQSCGTYFRDAKMMAMYGGMCPDCVKNNLQKKGEEG